MALVNWIVVILRKIFTCTYVKVKQNVIEDFATSSFMCMYN